MERQFVKYLLFIYMKYVGIRIIIDKREIITNEAPVKINMAEPAWAVHRPMFKRCIKMLFFVNRGKLAAINPMSQFLQKEWYTDLTISGTKCDT